MLSQRVRYAKERIAFSKPIASFGLVQQMIADCAAGIFAGESWSIAIGAIEASLEELDGGCREHVGNPKAHRRVRRRMFHCEGVVLRNAGAVVDQVVQFTAAMDMSRSIPRSAPIATRASTGFSKARTRSIA